MWVIKQITHINCNFQADFNILILPPHNPIQFSLLSESLFKIVIIIKLVFQQFHSDIRVCELSEISRALINNTSFSAVMGIYAPRDFNSLEPFSMPSMLSFQLYVLLSFLESICCLTVVFRGYRKIVDLTKFLNTYCSRVDFCLV